MEPMGTGIRRIRDEAREQGCRKPEFETTGFFTAIFRPNPNVRAQVRGQVTPDAAPEVTPELNKMLSVMVGEMTRGEIQKKLELKDEKHFRENYQQVAVKLALIEMTIPDKPRNSKQRYRITPLGKKMLERHKTRDAKVN